MGVVVLDGCDHCTEPKSCDDTEEIIIFGCKKAYTLYEGSVLLFSLLQVITQIQARLDISPHKVWCVLLL